MNSTILAAEFERAEQGRREWGLIPNRRGLRGSSGCLMPLCGGAGIRREEAVTRLYLGGAAKINDCGFENLDVHRHLSTMSDTVDAVFDPADFSFVVKMRGGPEKPWIWEVHCAGKAKPVERSPVFYKSAAAAAKEGKKALARILKSAA